MSIRLSDLLDLEIVNVFNGYKYGYLGDSEIIFDKKSGEIKSVLVEDENSRFLFLKGKDFIEIPWNSKIKIGEKTLIIDYKG